MNMKQIVNIFLVVIIFVFGCYSISLAKSKYSLIERLVSSFLDGHKEKMSVNLTNGHVLLLYEKQVGIVKHHKLAVSEKNNIILKYHGKGSSSFVLPYSNSLIAGRYYIFLEQEIDPDSNKIIRAPKIAAIDFKNKIPIAEFIKIDGEQGEDYLGIDVDQSGNYVLLPYLIDDPEYPCIRVYDYAKGRFYLIDTDQLMDYHFEKMHWKQSIDLIEFHNFMSGKDEVVKLDWLKKRIVVKNQ